jgi:hypothetical protein
VWGMCVGCGEGCVGRDRVCVEGWGEVCDGRRVQGVNRTESVGSGGMGVSMREEVVSAVCVTCVC